MNESHDFVYICGMDAVRRLSRDGLASPVCILQLDTGNIVMSNPFSTSQFSHLIGLIYDAAIRPARWSEAIEAIRVALNFENAALSLQALHSGEVLLNVTANIPRQYADRMRDYSADVVDQWGGVDAFNRFPIGEPRVLSRVNPRAVDFATTRNRYSREWAQPQGLADLLAIGLLRDERHFGALGLGRHINTMPILEAEIDGARLLIPHLQRAAEINRLLDIALLARSTFEATLDSLAVPVLLVTESCTLVHANPRAQDLLTDADLLGLHSGRLVGASHGITSALAAALAIAAHDESAIGCKGLGIPAWRPDGSVAALHVLPLRPSRMPASGCAIAAIFVAQANTPRAAPSELVASLFGLTPRETRVFELLATGCTAADVATTLTISGNTVKTHLARLFEKTGTRRQSELLDLAASLTLPVIGAR